MNATKTYEMPFTKGDLCVVIGSGASGIAAARLLMFFGARVRMLDNNEKAFDHDFIKEHRLDGIELVAAKHQFEHFKDASLVIPSPGVPMSKLQSLLDEAGNIPWISELELGYSFVKETILAITGTSGKTTTASLAAAMLEEAGKRVFLGGNIGTPLSEYIYKRENGEPCADVLVLEVSSFQLQGCITFKPHVAVLLNLSANHLDYHKDMQEYTDCKFNLFKMQDSLDFAIFSPSLADEVNKRELKSTVEYYSAPKIEWKSNLLGSHNQMNIEAAFEASSKLGVSYDNAVAAAQNFKPIENRLELVGEWNNITYVNDSKCTTVDALKVALNSFTSPVLLLAGGKFKGGDLIGLCPLIKEKVKAICLYGASREIFETAWKGSSQISYEETLEAAMILLRKIAEAGDVILMAPATASYDQYVNYLERGNDFRRIARMLK